MTTITVTGTVTIITTAITMAEAGADPAALYRLQSWLSPAYPVGAFTYSHGMEWAVETGDVCDRASLLTWIRDVLSSGAGHNDAILLAAAWRAARTQDRATVAEIATLARALAPSAERLLEATAQGQAFRRATAHAWPVSELALLDDIAEPVVYPVAVAMAAAGHGIPLRVILHAFLHAMVANLVSAGVRLVPLGQSDGLAVEAGLEREVATTAQAAEAATLDDLGGACLLADIASMKHETQHTRLFRS